ncbi:unnamed protein product, partial [Medioppia subpectinata]
KLVSIGVLTSGGDSQGMNAVIRAVVRMGLYNKFKVYLIYEGYNGLIFGDHNYIEEANLFSVDHIIHMGGTIIGSSRCPQFRQIEGRITAALSLISRNITNLVVIGGDGSLTGADLLQQEWTEILNTLVQRNKITEEMKARNSRLNIIGIVGSIDNDFCQTEITTGADTALHRIVESVDAIATTATSHQRAMIIEVMGRNCGYLALVSALAVEATFTFFPESPPDNNWPEFLVQKIENERKNGRRLNIIIISEGALDMNGQQITAKMVQNVISNKTKRDVRITILGHIQRGGLTSAYDRILGSRMGATAVQESQQMAESCVLTMSGNKIIKKSLIETVKQTRSIATAMQNKEWSKCVELRGYSFGRNFQTLKSIYGIYNSDKMNGHKIAVIQVGEPSPGMNASILGFVRHIIINENTAIGIQDGFDGLISGKYSAMKWSDVNGWTSQSGALMGTSKVPADITDQHIECVVKYFTDFQISGFLIIGGFRAFQLALKLIECRNKYTALKIPIAIIPATIDNNIPGTDFSLGTDSTLNKITNLCTDIIVSLKGTKRRLFIININSDYCGYLTILSALASGADYCYAYECDFTIDSVRRDANNIKNKMLSQDTNRLILVNCMANTKLKTKTITEIYTEEGKD